MATNYGYTSNRAEVKIFSGVTFKYLASLNDQSKSAFFRVKQAIEGDENVNLSPVLQTST